MRNFIILFCVFFAFAAIAFDLFDSKETKIKKQIEAANYCEKTSDCTYVSYGCPFGCWNYINKSEEVALKAEVGKSLKDCVYKCPIPKFNDKLPICENKKCVAASPENINKVFEDYTCEQIQPVLKNQIDYRSYCEKDSDCKVLDGSKDFPCKVLVSAYSENNMIDNYHKYAAKCGQQNYKACIIPQKVGCVENSCKVIK